MIRLAAIALALLALVFVPLQSQRKGMRVGSKKFTESVILGEVASDLARSAGVEVTHYRELGGTQLVFQALVQGDIDLYPDYTGTIAKELLAGEEAGDEEAIRARLAERGVRMSGSLGFENSYAVGMLKERAKELGIARVSDLTRHPELKLGLANEFLDREDGWRMLKRHYGLPQRDVTGLDHDVSYRQLALGAIDLMVVYTTDAKILEMDLAVLEDDRRCFPKYDAVLLYREDLESRYPKALAAVERLAGAVPVAAMSRMNGRAERDRVPETTVAADFVRETFKVSVGEQDETRFARIRDRTIEHLDLVRKSLIPAIMVAVPLGVLAAKRPKAGQVILAVVGIIQTMPALALLVMLMPLTAGVGLQSVGLGSATAVVALFLYGLLPIVRNTFEGLRGISREHEEASLALGLPAGFRLTAIELPLASRSIMAGIKTAAVINVGFATLGALVGAGGYGQPILTGIRLNDTALILEGAVPAAVLALVVQGGFELLERLVTPRGLRVGREAYH